MKTQVQKEVLKLVPKTSYHHDRVIFLENSNGLDYEGAADTLREFLIENKIRHHVEYNLGSKTTEELEEIAASCLDSLVVIVGKSKRGKDFWKVEWDDGSSITNTFGGHLDCY